MTTVRLPDQFTADGITLNSTPTPPSTPPASSNVGISPTSAYTFRTMALREIRDYTQHLAGRIKTIVDAAISDPQQNKAVKDLVHAAMWTEHYDAVKAWAEVATVRHMTPTNEPSQCIPGFPFATDHTVPATI